MYMPHTCNHEEWETCRAKYNADWKEKHQDKKKLKAESDASSSPKKSSDNNLYLAKSFKSMLSTQVMLSNQEANQLVDDVLNEKFTKYDELK